MRTLSRYCFVTLFVIVVFVGNCVSSPEGEKDSTRIFYLGEIVIVGIQDGFTAPFRQSYVQRAEIDDHHLLDASRALNTLPGLSLANVGSRNESMVYIRGFDLRQVPVFLDGIPEYVPYDGYVDLARFTTFDLSEITVTKGFSSVLYGANALGGAINLITRRPETSLDYNAAGGIANGNGYNYSLTLGTNQGLYYVEGSASRLRQNSFPLSKVFTATPTENGGERDNSYRKDSKYSVKTGFTPNGTDEYSFSFVNQQGEKGNPVYAGLNKSTSIRYWRWPDWDKMSEYLITQTVVGDKSSDNNFLIKTRFFHDKFTNTVFSYDDANYSTQIKKSSFQNYYDDDTWGSVIEASTRFIEKHKLTTAFHWKHDIHREHNLGEAVRIVRDATISFGVEDVYRLHDRVSIIGGVSYDIRKSLQAQDYDSKTKIVSDFLMSNSEAWNLQIGSIFTLYAGREISISVAKKTRFATMKDRYSYKLGTAIPNPGLKPEMAINYDLSYHEIIGKSATYKVNLFYNDVRDVIQQVSNVQGNLYQMQNLGKARYYGVETEVTVRPISAIDLGANYTLLKRENISNPSVRFLDTPVHKAAIYIGIIPIAPVDIRGSMEYDSKRFSTSDGIYVASAFTVFNINASISVHRNVVFYAGIENVLDRNYSIVDGYPEAGRTGYITLRFHN